MSERNNKLNNQKLQDAALNYYYDRTDKNFNEVYKRGRRFVTNFIYKISYNSKKNTYNFDNNDIGLIIDNIMETVWRKFYQYDPEIATFKAWLGTIAIHSLFGANKDKYKKNKVYIANFNSFINNNSTAYMPRYTDDFNEPEKYLSYPSIEDVLKELEDPFDRDVLYLKYVKKVKIKDIATMYKKTESTIKSRIRYAKIKLNKKFKDN